VADQKPAKPPIGSFGRGLDVDMFCGVQWKLKKATVLETNVNKFQIPSI